MVCPACPVIGVTALVVAVGGAGVTVALGVKITVGVVAVGSVAYGIYYNYVHKYEYLRPQESNLNSDDVIVSGAKNSQDGQCIKGSQETNILESTKATKNHFNGKQGADIFIVRDASKDYFYFSLCTTKGEKGSGNFNFAYFTTTYKIAPIIYNFKEGEDVLRIFCSKNNVSPNQIHAEYNQVQNITVVKIDIPILRAFKVPLFYDQEAVLVEGYHESLLGENPTGIELNVPYSDFCS